MAIGPVGSVDKLAATHDLISRKVYQSSTDEQDAKQGGMPAQDIISVSLDRSAATMGKLGVTNEEKNLFAKNIRETEHALQGVANNIDKMKVHLEKIVKNWPPFSADSAERKQILMSYVSLRKEIEQMTVPPPPQPLYEKNKALWENLGYEKLVKDIPRVSESTEDKQLRTALKGIDELQSAIIAGRNELASAAS